MIHSQDRSGWIGASDTAKVMGSWRSKSFARWWAVKLGLLQEGYSSLPMQTGSAYEHRILTHLGVKRLDRQIRLPRLRLRVNLDGEDGKRVYEVKTYGGDRFKLSRAYWMQCQVEGFASGKACQLIAYQLEPEDYHNWFREIAPERISRIDVEYDPEWIQAAYLPRLGYLAGCLRKGEYPDEKSCGCGEGADRQHRRAQRDGDGSGPV